MKKYLILLLAYLTINCSNFGIENFNPNFAFDAFKELEAEEDFKAKQKITEKKQTKSENKDKRAALLAQIWEGEASYFDGAAIVEAEVKRLFKGLERDNVFGVLNFEDIVVPRLIIKYQAQLNDAFKKGDFDKIIDLYKNFNKFKEIVLNYKKQKMSEEYPRDISQSIQEYVVNPKLADMPEFISRRYLTDIPFSSASPKTQKKLDQLEANFETALS